MCACRFFTIGRIVCICNTCKLIHKGKKTEEVKSVFPFSKKTWSGRYIVVTFPHTRLYSNYTLSLRPLIADYKTQQSSTRTYAKDCKQSDVNVIKAATRKCYKKVHKGFL